MLAVKSLEPASVKMLIQRGANLNLQDKVKPEKKHARVGERAQARHMHDDEFVLGCFLRQWTFESLLILLSRRPCVHS